MVFRFPVCIGGQLGSVGAVRSVDVPFPVWVGGGSGAVGVPKGQAGFRTAVDVPGADAWGSPGG